MHTGSVSGGVRQRLGSSTGSTVLWGLVAGAAVLALGGTSAPAGLAQDYPLESASASMEDVRLTSGGSTTISGRGWLPGSTVTVTLLPDSGEVAAQSEPRTVARTEVGSDGAFSVDVTIPDDLPPGDYLLRVSGTDADGEPTRVEMTFTVEPEPADEGEPVDGEPGGDEAPGGDQGPEDGSAGEETLGRDGIPAGEDAPASERAPAGSEEPPADEAGPGVPSIAFTGLGLLGGLVLAAVLLAAGWVLLRITRNRRTRIDL